MHAARLTAHTHVTATCPLSFIGPSTRRDPVRIDFRWLASGVAAGFVEHVGTVETVL